MRDTPGAQVMRVNTAGGMATELREVQIVADGLAFPEGPVAMRDGTVLVAEIGGGSVARVGRDGTVERVAIVRGGPNGAAIGPDGALYVCNNGGFRAEDRIEPCGIEHEGGVGGRRRKTTEMPTRCHAADKDIPIFRVRLHADPIAQNCAAGVGAGRINRENGVGLSPDGTVLYWAETPTRQVQRRRLVAPGRVAHADCDVRALFRPSGADRYAVLAGLPGCHELDSLAIDSAGSVVVGTLVDSGVSEIRDDGSWTLHKLPPALADPLVTNVCFGGADLTTLYVTCSKTGRLLRATWHCPGAPLAFTA